MKGIRPVKTEWWGAGVVICLERVADLHMAQLIPLPLTVSCFSKIQIGFPFLLPAHLGNLGKGPLNGCVYVWLISPQRRMLETSNFVHELTMWSLSLVVSECSLSGRGQGHVSNFYIMDLENFATASRRYTGDIHNSVHSRFMTPYYYYSYKTMEATRSRHGWVHMFITHRPTVTLRRHNLDLSRTCCTSSFCTVAWQLARFQLTRRIARSLGDSWASCYSQKSQRSGTANYRFCITLYRRCNKYFIWIRHQISKYQNTLLWMTTKLI